MSESIDFLTPTIAEIRKSILGIDDSYSNPWDVIAELAQNSVDAIKKTGQNTGRIVIEIDCRSTARKITVFDNGCGISKEDLPRYLRPFSSGKDADPDTIGEKGVGLKFVMFQSAKFEVQTSDGENFTTATVLDARNWKTRTDAQPLNLELESGPGNGDFDGSGTKVIVENIEGNHEQDLDAVSIFELDFTQFVQVLRTKTAIGYSNAIWGERDFEIEVQVVHIDANGKRNDENVPFEYYLPIEGLEQNDIIDIDKFEQWLKSGDRTDDQKRRMLQRKIFVKADPTYTRGNKLLPYWFCFLPKRAIWDQLNINAGLITQEEIDGPTSAGEDYSYCQFGPSITVSTKGMPTGIVVPTPSNAGNAGYWDDCFMIIQDDRLEFDIGRKSIPGRTRAMYQEVAHSVFNSLMKYVTKYVAGTDSRQSDFAVSAFNPIDVWQKLEKIPDLESEVVKFKKNPARQEASIAAVFFELIGNEIIKDIIPVYLGYKNRYDIYAEISGQFKTGDFKTRLRNIVKDFSDTTKLFSELQFIICWEVTSDDEEALLDQNMGLEEVNRNSLGRASELPSAVTHLLTLQNCNPIWVIDLKKVMSDYEVS